MQFYQLASTCALEIGNSSFFCMYCLQAALHEPSFRDFRLTLRGLAATASLLSTIHVADILQSGSYRVQLNGNETTPFNTERLDQARVGLPGCGNHKTPFSVIGLRSIGPKGVKPLTEKGGLCLRLLLKAKVRLLRKEAGCLGVLVPAQDFRPPLSNVGNCYGKRLQLARRVGLVGDVSKGREGQDLPGQLAFQRFLRHLLLLNPLRVV